MKGKINTFYMHLSLKTLKVSSILKKGLINQLTDKIHLSNTKGLKQCVFCHTLKLAFPSTGPTFYDGT